MTELDELKLQLKPSFVSIGKDSASIKVHEKETGITQCRLSNGVSINYKVYYLSLHPIYNF